MTLAGAGIRGISVEMANRDLQRVCSYMTFRSRLSLLQPLSCFSLASISLLDTRKETLTGSRIDNSPIEDKFIGTVFYADSNAAPVAVQTKSRSSSEANNLPPSTLVPLSSGMPREETVAEPALNLPPDGEATSAAVETLQGSTRGPSTDEPPPPEPSGSQEVKESTGFYGSAASPRSDPPLRHAASRRPRVVQADRDNIAKKLNRAELSRLLEGKRALSRAPLR